MPSDDQLKGVMTSTMDQLTAVCRDHEAADHGGEPCIPGRAGIAAFVFVQLGLCPFDLRHMLLFSESVTRLANERDAQDKKRRKKKRDN